MKERPILFSGEMVRAILDGRKTMTRRVIKPQPRFIESSGRWEWPIPTSKIHKGCCTSVVTASREWWEYLMPDQFPYRPWDRLWVRETWQNNPYGGIVYRAGSGIVNCAGRGWRPSIFMPRWASRITLEITGVRVERVRDISESDAKAEGVTPSIVGRDFDYLGYRAGFQSLWDSINSKRGYSWASNPWVWVVEFKRVTS
jgi:hypothetical protein